MTKAELDEMRPASEVFPPDVFASLLALPGSQEVSIRKTEVTIALDHDVLAAFQATGDAWQARVNDVLRREAAELMSASAGAKRSI